VSLLRRVRDWWRGGRRTYAAAKTTTSTGGWTAVSQDVNTEIGTSRKQIDARVRQLVRDMPHAARAIDVLCDWTVGSGLTLQSRVTGSDGKLDKTLNTQIEDAWKWWADEADLSRCLHLYDLQALALRQQVELGESLVLFAQTTSAGRFLPLALRVVEPDALSDFAAKPLDGNQVLYGVEYDPRTSRRMAYHFNTLDAVTGQWSGRPLRIAAPEVVHTFKTLRPGQLRGVSPFAPAVILADDLDQYLGAEIDAAKLAAKYLAWVSSDDPAAAMAAFGSQQSSLTDRKVQELGNATTVFLKNSEKVTVADNNRPGSSFDPFTRFVLKTFSATLGVPYELLSGNYEGLNYTVLRGVRNDFAQQLSAQRARFVRGFCQPLQRKFLDWCVLTGRLDLPNYFANPWPYLRSVWLGPGMLPVDPLKEGRADADAISARLKSPQETILERGRDPEEVLDEIAEWEDMLEERDLQVEVPSAPLKTNPAALDEEADPAEEEDDEDEDDSEDSTGESADRSRVLVVHTTPPPAAPAEIKISLEQPAARTVTRKARRTADGWVVEEVDA
jgi:lambda family phage portal protein